MKKYLLLSIVKNKVCLSLFILLFSMGIIGCSQKSAYEKSTDGIVSTEEIASEDYTNAPKEKYTDVVSSSIATTSVPGRKLIKTSELKFKVDNVFRSTQYIENVVSNNGGFVTLSELKSTIDYSRTIRSGKDSSASIDYVTRIAKLKFRVPSSALDSCLRAIAPHITYLDYRTIQANDITISMLSNELLQKRNGAFATSVQSKMGKKAKLEDITSAEKEMYIKKEQSDLALTTNLELKDQIEYSTVSINIYEPQFETIRFFKDSPAIEKYEDPFFTLLSEQIINGWDGLKEFVLFITGIWEVILLFSVAIFIFIKVRKRKI